MPEPTIIGRLTPIGGLRGTLSGRSAISGKLNIPERITPTPYEGPYQFTPTTEPQIVATRDLFMTSDLVIEAIPNNYGLITYNGAYLTVS